MREGLGSEARRSKSSAHSVTDWLFDLEELFELSVLQFSHLYFGRK